MATLRQLKIIEGGGGNAYERIELIEQLADGNQIDDESLQAIIRSEGNRGSYLPTKLVAKLIVQTRSADLYDKVKHWLFQDMWALVEVFNSEYPDQDIEDKLLDELSRWYDADDFVRRKHIVKALADHASTKATRLLSELLAEHIPKVQAKVVLSNAMKDAGAFDDPESLPSIEYSPLFISVEREFVELLADAIERISRRARPPRDAGKEAAADSSIVGTRCAQLGERVMRLRQQAAAYSETDAKAALLYVRQAAEAICKSLCKENGIETKQPLDQMMLGDILSATRNKGVFEGHIEGVATAISKICGAALHDQGPSAAPVSRRVADCGIGLLDELADWYFGSPLASSERSA